MTKPDPVERGLPAERCAAAIVQAIRKDKAEIHIGGTEIAGHLRVAMIPRFAPPLGTSFCPVTICRAMTRASQNLR